MQATAKLSNYRQAPRKVRLIAGLVRGKRVDVALLELDHRAKRAAPQFAKLIKSALANAKALGMKTDDLIVKEVRVDKGPIIKRSRPRAQGRAFPIHKHTCTH
jgi:large subunit ribosomal protein L22